MAEICRGYLTFIQDDGENGSRYPVTSEICYIGSDADCNVRLRHVDIDNRHCLIKVLHFKKATVHCLCREKPVLLNDHPVDEGGSSLKHGDIIQIVGMKFKWEDNESSKTVFRSYSTLIERNHSKEADCKRFSEPLVSNFDDENLVENKNENEPNLSCNLNNPSKNDVETKVTQCTPAFEKSVDSISVKKFTSSSESNRTTNCESLHSGLISSPKDTSQIRRSRSFSQTYKTKSTVNTPEKQNRNLSVVKSCSKNTPLQENNRTLGREVKSRFQLSRNSFMKSVTPVTPTKVDNSGLEETNQHSNLTVTNNGLHNEVENIMPGNEELNMQITINEKEVTIEEPTFETTVPSDVVDNPSLLATPKCFTKAFHSTPKGLELSKLETKSKSTMIGSGDVMNGGPDRSNETTQMYNFEDNSMLASPVKSVRDTENLIRKKKGIEISRIEQDLSIEIRRHTRNTSNILKKTFEEHCESNILSSEKNLTTPEKLLSESNPSKNPTIIIDGTELESYSPEKKNDRKSICDSNKSPLDFTSELSAENGEVAPSSLENRDKSQKHDDSNSVARCARNLSYISPPENNKSQEYMDSVVSTPKKTFMDNEVITSSAMIACSTPPPKESAVEPFSPLRNRRSTGILPCVGTPSDVYRTTKGGLTPMCKSRFNRTSMEVEVSMGPRDSLSGLIKPPKLIRQKPTERKSTPLKADKSSVRDSLQMHSPIVEEYALEAEESQNESLNNDSQYKFVSKRRRRLAKSSFGVEDRILEESELNQSDISDEENVDGDSLVPLESFGDENSEFVSTRIVINQTGNDSENVLNSTYTLESPEESNNEKLESPPPTSKMIIPKSILTPLPRQPTVVRDKSAKKVTFIDVKEDSVHTDISTCTGTDVDSEFDLHLSTSNVNVTTDVFSSCGEKSDDNKNESEDERLYMSDKSSDVFSANNTFESSGSIVEKIIAKRDKKVNRTSRERKSKSPRLSGVKRLLNIPKSPKSDYMNVSGVKEMMKTPETVVGCEKTPEKLNVTVPTPKNDVNVSVSATHNKSITDNDSTFATPTMRRCSKHFRIHRSSICLSLVSSLNSSLEETMPGDCSASLDNSIAELNHEKSVPVPSQSPKTTFKDVLTELKEKLIKLQENKNKIDKKTLENSLNVINDVLLDEPVSDDAAAITEETFKNVLLELKEKFSTSMKSDDLSKSAVAVEFVHKENSTDADNNLVVTDQDISNISFVKDRILNTTESKNTSNSVVESEGKQFLPLEQDFTETSVSQKSAKTEVSIEETLHESEVSIEGSLPETRISISREEHVTCDVIPVEQSEIQVSMAVSEEETEMRTSEEPPEIFVSGSEKQLETNDSISDEMNITVPVETDISISEKTIGMSIPAKEKLPISEKPLETNISISTELLKTEITVSENLLETHVSTHEKQSETNSFTLGRLPHDASHSEKLAVVNPPVSEKVLERSTSDLKESTEINISTTDELMDENTTTLILTEPLENNLSALEEAAKTISVQEKSPEMKNSLREKLEEDLAEKLFENTVSVQKDENETDVCVQKIEKKSIIEIVKEELDSQGVELSMTDSEDVCEHKKHKLESEKVLSNEIHQESEINSQDEEKVEQRSQIEESVSQYIVASFVQTLEEFEQAEREALRSDKSQSLVGSSPKVSGLEDSSVVDETFKTCSLASNITFTTNADEKGKSSKIIESIISDKKSEKFMNVSSANFAVNEENKENLLSLTPVTIDGKEKSFVRSPTFEKEIMPVPNESDVTKSSQSVVEIDQLTEKHSLQIPVVEKSLVDEKTTVAESAESHHDIDVQNISLSSSPCPSDVELETTLEENLSCIEPSMSSLTEENLLSDEENLSNNQRLSQSSISLCEDEKTIDESLNSQNKSLNTSESIGNCISSENCSQSSSGESDHVSGSENADLAALLPISRTEMITPPKSTAICVNIEKVAQLTLAGPVMVTEMRNSCKSISTSTPLCGADSLKILEIPQSCSTTIGSSVSPTVDDGTNEISSETSQTIIDEEKEQSAVGLSSSPAEIEPEKSEKEFNHNETSGMKNVVIQVQVAEVSVSEQNCLNDTVGCRDELTLVTNPAAEEIVSNLAIIEPKNKNNDVAASENKKILCDRLTNGDEAVQKVLMKNVENNLEPNPVANEKKVSIVIPITKSSQEIIDGAGISIKVPRNSGNLEKSLILDNNNDDAREQAPRVKRERRTTRYTELFKSCHLCLHASVVTPLSRKSIRPKNGSTGLSSKRGRKTTNKTSALMDISVELARIDSPVKEPPKVAIKRKTVHFDESSIESEVKKSNRSASIENVHIPTPKKRKTQRNTKVSEKSSRSKTSSSREIEIDNLVSPCSIVLPKIQNNNDKVETADSAESQLMLENKPKVSKRTCNTRKTRTTGSSESCIEKSSSNSTRGNKGTKSKNLQDEFLPSEEKRSKRKAVEKVQTVKDKDVAKDSKTTSKRTTKTNPEVNDDLNTNKRSTRRQKLTESVVHEVVLRKTRRGEKMIESTESTSNSNSSNSSSLKKTKSKEAPEKSVAKSPERVEKSKKSKKSPEAGTKRVMALRVTRNRKGGGDDDTSNIMNNKSGTRNEVITSTEVRQSRATKRLASASSDSLNSGIVQKKPRISIDNSCSPAIARATRSRKVNLEAVSNKIGGKMSQNANRNDNSVKNKKIKQNEAAEEAKEEQKVARSVSSKKKNDASPKIQKIVKTRAAKTKSKSEKSPAQIAPVLRVTRSQNSSTSSKVHNGKK